MQPDALTVSAVTGLEKVFRSFASSSQQYVPLRTALGSKVTFLPLRLLLPTQWETKDIYPTPFKQLQRLSHKRGSRSKLFKYAVTKKHAPESCKHARIAQGSLHEERPSVLS